MSNQVRQFIGIIAAEANSLEQRQIIKGIVAEAQGRNQTAVIFSNVYNPYEYDMRCGLKMISTS